MDQPPTATGPPAASVDVGQVVDLAFALRGTTIPANGLLVISPDATRFAATSRRVCAVTMHGHLPPSSSVTGVRWRAAAAMTDRPTGALPVKKRVSNGTSSNGTGTTADGGASPRAPRGRLACHLSGFVTNPRE